MRTQWEHDLLSSVNEAYGLSLVEFSKYEGQFMEIVNQHIKKRDGVVFKVAEAGWHRSHWVAHIDEFELWIQFENTATTTPKVRYGEDGGGHSTLDCSGDPENDAKKLCTRWLR